MLPKASNATFAIAQHPLGDGQCLHLSFNRRADALPRG